MSARTYSPGFEKIFEEIKLGQPQKSFLSYWKTHTDYAAKKMEYSYRVDKLLNAVTMMSSFAILPLLFAADCSLSYVKVVIFVLCLTVIFSVTLERLFRYKEIGRHYQFLAQNLNREGWQFLFLNGYYSHFETHEDAFEDFVLRIGAVQKQSERGFIDLFDSDYLASGPLYVDSLTLKDPDPVSEKNDDSKS